MNALRATGLLNSVKDKPRTYKCQVILYHLVSHSQTD